jgi:AraC-like DNA-binding protein
MTKKTAIPDEIAQALAMREVGYTVLSISQRLGLSVRSLQRHFAAHGAVKGGLKQELMDAARAELMKRVTSDDAIRDEVAQLVNDDLAHTRHLRSLMLVASEQLHANSLSEAVLVMRAAAAYSTAIKNTSDTLRQVMRVERAVVVAEAALPELVVRELTGHEVEALRVRQEDQAA